MHVKFNKIYYNDLEKFIEILISNTSYYFDYSTELLSLSPNWPFKFKVWDN